MDPNDGEKKSAFRVVMVAEDFSRLSGGVPAVVHQLSGRLAAHGIETHVVFSHIDPMTPPAGVISHYVPASKRGTKWYWGPELATTLDALARSNTPTIFHIHGVWSGPQFLAAKAAQKNNIPYIVSAHGMLEPWLWRNQKIATYLKKKLYWLILARHIFKKARILHGITQLEADNLRALIPKVPIEVIPNAIDVQVSVATENKLDREKIVLFIGRLDKKKGVDLLIQAFAKATIGSDWLLAIAGPAVSEAYMNQLRELASLTPNKTIEFLGPIFSEDKESWMKRAWVLAAPSHSEVVGLVNLEAASNYLPSITTHQTGLDKWEQTGGLLVNPNAGELCDALEQACAWNMEERIARGQKGRAYVKSKYGWNVVEPAWVDLYSRIAGSTNSAVERPVSFLENQRSSITT